MKNKILELRKAQNLTQRQLASMLNIHYQVLQRWESGERFPTVDIAIRIARALDVTVEYLFPIDED